MNEPVWLELSIVIDVHSEQLALFGGPEGVRDVAMLESALARPMNKFACGETDIAALAAAYAFGFARNHPSWTAISGRPSRLSSCFLALTELTSMCRRLQATAMILSLAAGEVAEEGLTRWIRDNWPET